MQRTQLTLEIGKLYKTKGGYKAEVKRVERDANYPVLCEVMVAEGGKAHAVYYTGYGRAGTFSFFYDIDSEWTGWT